MKTAWGWSAKLTRLIVLKDGRRSCKYWRRRTGISITITRSLVGGCGLLRTYHSNEPSSPRVAVARETLRN